MTIRRYNQPAGILLAVTALLAASAFAQEGDETPMSSNPQAVLHTSMGDITVELFEDKAPKTVANFIEYTNEGFYAGTVFHRVISSFMIQGGGFTAEMVQKPTRDPVENEAANGLKNKRGTLAMARTPDPHSATSQFFINVENNNQLDFTSTSSSRGWGYTVFGKVVDGMEVVDEIRFVDVANKGMHQNVPVEAVVIESVEIVGGE